MKRAVSYSSFPDEEVICRFSLSPTNCLQAEQNRNLVRQSIIQYVHMFIWIIHLFSSLHICIKYSFRMCLSLEHGTLLCQSCRIRAKPDFPVCFMVYSLLQQLGCLWKRAAVIWDPCWQTWCSCCTSQATLNTVSIATGSHLMEASSLFEVSFLSNSWTVIGNELNTCFTDEVQKTTTNKQKARHTTAMCRDSRLIPHDFFFGDS